MVDSVRGLWTPPVGGKANPQGSAAATPADGIAMVELGGNYLAARRETPAAPFSDAFTGVPREPGPRALAPRYADASEHPQGGPFPTVHSPPPRPPLRRPWPSVPASASGSATGRVALPPASRTPLETYTPPSPMHFQGTAGRPLLAADGEQVPQRAVPSSWTPRRLQLTPARSWRPPAAPEQGLLQRRSMHLEPLASPPASMRSIEGLAASDRRDAKGATPDVRYPTEPPEYPFPTLCSLAPVTKEPPALLGVRTRFRPLWLLLLGSTGNVLYGVGSVILERAVWPHGVNGLPPIGLGPHAGPAAAGGGGAAPPPRVGHPRFNDIWGGRSGGLAVGTVLTALGMGVAAGAATLLYLDARRLARRNHAKAGAPGSVSYTWPNFYFTTHLCGIGMLVSHRFLIEMTRDDNRADWLWYSTLPGVLGSSIFSVTQARSACGSELYHGKMPLWRRDILGAAARGGVAFYTLFGAMAGIPGFNPYVREFVRLVAMTSFTLACFLQLATARQAIAQRTPLQAATREVTSWRPAVRWATWLVGRTMIGFGPNLFERGYYTYYFVNRTDNASGINRHAHDEDGRNIIVNIAAGSWMIGAGIMLDLLATGLMRYDAIAVGKSSWGASGLMLGAAVGMGCMAAYRGVIEFAKDHLAPNKLLVSMLPGLIGTGLLFALVPILFSYAELRHGDIPIDLRLGKVEILQRDRLTTILRCLAGGLFPLWSVMAAIGGFDSFGREAVLIGASLCFQIANSLPTTTTRRGRPQFQFPRTPGVGVTPAPMVGGMALASV